MRSDATLAPVSRLLVLLLLASACVKSPRSPFFGDENYIRVGLDPWAEAKELTRLYAERGEGLALKLAGRDFTALGFMDRSGRSTRARVVTRRGIEVALDPEASTPLSAARTYALIAGPFSETQDVDRDGFEEVFIERRSAQQHCLLVYRVRDVGYVDAVPVEVFTFGRDLCPSAVEDVDGDGRAELLVNIALPEFDLDSLPEVRAVLWAHSHRFVLNAEPQKLEQFLHAQEHERERDLQQARSKRKRGDVLRLAVELAALAHLRGASVDEQIARLDGALHGLRLHPHERDWLLLAHERIRHLWHAPPPPPRRAS